MYSTVTFSWLPLGKIRHFLRQRSAFFYWFITSLCASIFILIGFLAYSYSQISKLYDGFGSIEHSYRVIDRVELSIQKLGECEGNVRGYALSQRKSFVGNYSTSVKSVHDQLNQATNLTKDNPAQQNQIQSLHKLVNERLALLDTSLAVVDGRYQYQGDNDRIRKYERGRMLMAQIRSTKEEIRQQEERLLKNRHEQAHSTLRFSLLTILFSGLAGLTVAIQIAVVVFKFHQRHKGVEEQLLSLNESKNRLLSIIGHDLRGPLSNGSVLLKMLRDQGKELSRKEKNQMFDMAIDSVDHTSELLEDLLEWSRTQLKQTPFHPEMVTVLEAVEQNVAYLQSNAEQKQIQIHLRVDAAEQVFADKQMLHTVLRNLLSNAIKFTPREGTVSIRAIREEEMVQIAVEDTGIGMTREMIDKLFTIGEKHSTRGTANEKGTGLGLLLCKEFIERNNGTLQVASTPGKGSVFTVSLPAWSLQSVVSE